jgi:hypothetical protein
MRSVATIAVETAVCFACGLVAVALCAATVVFGGPAHVRVGDLDCVDFGTREAADRYLDDHPNASEQLDADEDGHACEGRPSSNAFGWSGTLIGGVLGGFVFTRWHRYPSGWARQRFDLEEWFAVTLGSVLLGGASAAFVFNAPLPRHTSAAVYAIFGAISTLITTTIFAKDGRFSRPQVTRSKN